MSLIRTSTDLLKPVDLATKMQNGNRSDNERTILHPRSQLIPRWGLLWAYSSVFSEDKSQHHGRNVFSYPSSCFVCMPTIGRCLEIRGQDGLSRQ